MTDDLSVPMWQCALCGAAGEAADAAAARAAALDHIQVAHAGSGSYEFPAARPQWVLDLEAKHGLPVEQIPGMVYALHYDPPRVVRSVSGDYAGPGPRSDSSGWLSACPIRHYVGWTQQQNPRKRIGRHAPLGVTEVVYVEPGTMADEHDLKQTGHCPKCGEPYRDSLAGAR